MRSESFEDKEPLAHFGSKAGGDEANDSYFNDINRDLDVPAPGKVTKA